MRLAYFSSRSHSLLAYSSSHIARRTTPASESSENARMRESSGQNRCQCQVPRHQCHHHWKMSTSVKNGGRWRLQPFASTSAMTAEFISCLNLAPYSSAQRDTFNNDGLLSIIQRNPHLARKKHDFTFASGAVPPLFMAVSLGANKELVSALVEACPSALGQTDRYGRTPLHQAVEFGSSADVVEYLLEQRPQSAADADHIGRTALHCSCAYSASLDIVRLLCKFCPRSVFQKDSRGRLPVHISAGQEDDGSSIQVVRYLLELHPHSVQERTAKGSTALELVEKGRASLEVMLSVSAVATMLKKNPTRATALSLIARLESMEWRSGVHLYLDINPSIIHTLDLHREEKLVPHVLSSVGKRCKLGTVFEIVKDMVECFEDQ